MRAVLLALAGASLVGALQMAVDGPKAQPVLYSVVMGEHAHHNRVRMLVDTARKIGHYKGTVVLATDRPECLAATMGSELLGGEVEHSTAASDTYPGVEGGKIHIVKVEKALHERQVKAQKAMALKNVKLAKVGHPVSSVILVNNDMIIGQSLDQFMKFVEAKEHDGKTIISELSESGKDHAKLMIINNKGAAHEKSEKCLAAWKKELLQKKGDHESTQLAQVKGCTSLHSKVSSIPDNFHVKVSEDGMKEHLKAVKQMAAFVHVPLNNKIDEAVQKAFFLAIGSKDAQLLGHTDCPLHSESLLQSVEGEFEALNRMQWWTTATEEMAPTEQYLLFTNDAGGLNNIRLGWEATGLIAQGTGRTLVLPPPSKMYLLDWGDRKDAPENTDTTTSVEDLLNLAQLKGNVPTLSAKEFEKRTGISWMSAVLQAQQLPSNMKDKCDMKTYRMIESPFLFLDGEQREGFSCMAWAQLGGPNENFRQSVGQRGWALLNHGFVWHDDAFAIASKVVNYLGLFDYTALHARFGDFQFHEQQQSPMAIFNKWNEYIPAGSVVYLATDDPGKFKNMVEKKNSLLQTNSGARVIMWHDLFEDTTDKLLSDLKQRYDAERWFKLTGPVEELICTYSKVFIGSPLSTFSGHIQRMRISAEAPVTSTIMHTDTPVMATINNQINLWQKLDKKHNFKALPQDKGSIFMETSAQVKADI